MKSLHQTTGQLIRARTSVALATTVIFAFAVVIAGCGGSGGAVSPTRSLLIAPPLPTTNAGGVWNGSLSNDLTGQSFAISGVVTEDNMEGSFITDGGRMFVLRDITGTDGDISAIVSAFARPDAVFIDGSFISSGILTGSVVERSRIEGNWSLDSGDAGTVMLEYDDIYERGSDIDWLVGTWADSSGTIYNIDALGEIFGQTERGCIYGGQIQVIDATRNVYRVHLMGGCLAINASGLGVLTDDLGTNDGFVLMLDLGNGWFIADTLLRQ